MDAGNNKKAIQEAEKLLKKHPTTYTAKALKALALIRMERASEAWPIVEEVDQIVRGGHNDENTLQVVCYCYKEGYVPEKIPLLIEEVVKREKNETLLLELFHGYARVRDHKNQQRVAQMLCKDFNKRQYVMWAISSIVLQVKFCFASCLKFRKYLVLPFRLNPILLWDQKFFIHWLRKCWRSLWKSQQWSLWDQVTLLIL